MRHELGGHVRVENDVAIMRYAQDSTPAKAVLAAHSKSCMYAELLRRDGAFDESKHPRDSSGRFDSGESFVNALKADKSMRDGIASWIGDQQSIKEQQKAGTPDKYTLGFERAVAAAPAHTGNAWRGIKKLTEEQGAAYATPGAVLSDAAHSSWTTNSQVAARFAKGDGVSVLFHTKSSQHLADIDPLKEIGEDEVISPKGTQMRVVSSKREGNTYRVEVEDA